VIIEVMWFVGRRFGLLFLDWVFLCCGLMDLWVDWVVSGLVV